jgi:hypothetical protein
MIGSALAMNGCATVLQPGPDRVRITSNPSVARVSVDGDVVCSTPCYARLSRKGDGLIWVEYEGYQREAIRLDRVPTGTAFVNILFPPGIVLDLIENNVSKFPTEPLHVELRPDNRFNGSAPEKPAPQAKPPSGQPVSIPGAEPPIEPPEPPGPPPGSEPPATEEMPAPPDAGNSEAPLQ